VGANGAGKTTLIKCLMDFSWPDSGEIRIGGVSNRDPASRAGLAFLPEKFTPPYYLNGHDFLRYMSGLYETEFADSRRDELLSVLDLPAAALARPVGQLSKGMGQKLGLLAMLLSDRPLLVMDEPMSGLDPRVRAHLKRYLLALKGPRRAMFFSTHLLPDVEVLCDRVAILHNGELAFVGAPAECCRLYGTEDFEEAYLRCIEARREGAAAG
jgi:ABC-2 type transport system ATP-binding protein